MRKLNKQYILEKLDITKEQFEEILRKKLKFQKF